MWQHKDTLGARLPGADLAAGTFLGYVNLVLLGLGADIRGEGTQLTGLFFASLILPVSAVTAAA